MCVCACGVVSKEVLYEFLDAFYAEIFFMYRVPHPGTGGGSCQTASLEPASTFRESLHIKNLYLLINFKRNDPLFSQIMSILPLEIVHPMDS